MDGTYNTMKDHELTMALTVSGGFATVQPGSVLSINAVEGYPLEDFSAEVSDIYYAQRQI